MVRSIPVELKEGTSPFRRFRKAILGGSFIVVVLILWEWASRTARVDPLFASSPTRIARTLGLFVVDPDFWGNLFATAQGFVFGWGTSVVLALILGILMGWYGPLRDTLEPFFAALYATPRIALIPLLLVWFGFGLNYKIAVVALLAFFPLLLNTIAGVRNADAALVRMAQVYCARDIDILRTVVLPGAVPFIVTGLRQSVALGLVGIVVGELFGSSAGLGYIITISAQRFQPDRVFAAISVLAIAGALLNEVLLRLENRFARWKPEGVAGAV